MSDPRSDDLPSTRASLSPQQPSGTGEEQIPERLGRYRVVARIGSGGFGVVYRAYDEELRREVAIKVPHRERLASAQAVDAYLKEARILATLDHPGIVPIHDVGRTVDGLCFLVSKLVEGRDLARRLQEGRPGHRESADVIARVAEALHHAHQRGLVHRDIKPANILLDPCERPVVVDFGLALREEDQGQGSGYSGTPAYMSPEQARGEGHRVDARTDVYSLGVVLYELLTGRRPFRGEDLTDLLDQIKTREPRPPRQLNDTIPKELDRVCLKALSKRAADRYSTAIDLADDLRHWLNGEGEGLRVVAVSAGSPVPTVDRSTPSSSPRVSELTFGSDQKPARIIPKGFRSFDATDADFFLDLLPGPRDRDGLPEGIRFWKKRVEETDSEKTFTVGLLYGPSGCGKSSLVKAGLLPRLATSVVTVYLEATPDGTEARLLKGLRKRCPDLPEGMGLAEVLANLRKGRGMPSGGKKVLIVLDQFEQWLHARPEEKRATLVEALRHCDGEHVQCLLMVRDDFWLAVSRFLRDLEVQLVEGQNATLVDLFDLAHSRKVLAEHGRAYGRLPEDLTTLSEEQDRFLDEAVAGLAQDGKVIPVRLALFAEMVKGRPWRPELLQDVGGMDGIGVKFLEETFTAKAAPQKYRSHQQAARAVLKALLPPGGSEIKGHIRSYAELRVASGYTRGPEPFSELLRILDFELRMITPADPEGLSPEESEESCPTPEEKYYQVTHDFLVSPLREWLIRKQKETWRGRAELLLAERATLWNTKHEFRQLPSGWEWLFIRLLTRKSKWSKAECRMMETCLPYLP